MTMDENKAAPSQAPAECVAGPLSGPMLCVPLDDPDGTFILRADGSLLYEKDFRRTALDRYCLQFVKDRPEMTLSGVIEEIVKSVRLGSKLSAIELLASEIYSRRVSWALPVPPDEAIKRFETDEYMDARVMKGVLSPREYAIWCRFRGIRRPDDGKEA